MTPEDKASSTMDEARQAQATDVKNEISSIEQILSGRQPMANHQPSGITEQMKADRFTAETAHVMGEVKRLRAVARLDDVRASQVEFQLECEMNTYDARQEATVTDVEDLDEEVTQHMGVMPAVVPGEPGKPVDAPPIMGESVDSLAVVEIDAEDKEALGPQDSDNEIVLPEKKSGMGGWLLTILIVGALAAGAFFYMDSKIDEKLSVDNVLGQINVLKDSLTSGAAE